MALFEDVKPVLNLELIASKLYMLPIKTQFCHHLTTSYAAHKALDTTYELINDLKDEIIEKLMGCEGRFKSLSLTSLSGFSEALCLKVADEIKEFGDTLVEYARKEHYNDIENLAQSYSGAGIKLKYLLSLS
jgi:hypothetical protein